MEVEDKKFFVPETVLDCIYVEMLNASERLEGGVHGLFRCLTWLEDEYGFERPTQNKHLR